MQDNFPTIIKRLCDLDSEEALIKERIFALSRLLQIQEGDLQRVVDTRLRTEAILVRLTEADTLYDAGGSCTYDNCDPAF